MPRSLNNSFTLPQRHKRLESTTRTDNLARNQARDNILRNFENIRNQVNRQEQQDRQEQRNRQANNQKRQESFEQIERRHLAERHR